MNLLAFEQSPSKIVSNAPMGFPSCWVAGWALPSPPCLLPPGTPPPPPGGPPPVPRGPPPDGPAPPAGVLNCIWVMMAVVIDILLLSTSKG